MPPGYRPLLPRPIGVASNSSLDTSLWQRERIEAACQNCRKRKIKCNGQRPACGACVDRGNPCAYVTNPEETRSQALKRKYSSVDEKLSVYNEFYDILRSRPLEEANDILHRLRAGASVESIVQHIKSADLLLQLSVQPPTRFRYSMGGILEVPGVLKTTDNPYIASLAYKIMPHQSSHSAATIGSGASDYLAMFDAPYHTVQMINADIDAAEPSKWTAVSSDDQLLRELLRSYFTFAYPFFAFFHKDHFLRDMLSGKRRFCSSLLVNCVMAVGCRGYSKLPRRFEFWDPASLYYRFIAEARRLWELEADEKSLTRIQAAMLLHLEYGLNGLDKIGWSFCVQAVATAQRISLFTTYIKPKNVHWRNVQAMTAWALFGWQGFRCYHFDRPTLVTTPPALPLPQELGAYGELWLKYPTASAPVSLRFSDMFRAIAEFCTIMNDIANDVFLLSGNKKPQTLAEAIMFRHKLQQWYNRLPDHLGPQNIIIPAHFHLHIHYWLVMMRLFEPLQVLEAYEHGTFPSSPLPPEESPRKIVSHAKKCLQTLVRLYYSCHGSDGLDSFIVLEASLIGFAMLTDVRTPCEDTAIQDGNESSAILCAHILYSQARMIYLSDVVFRVMQQNLTTNTTRKLAQFVNVSDIDEQRVGLIARQVQSEWPINISPLASIDNDRKLGHLFHAIAELSITDDGSGKYVSSKHSTPAP